MTRNLTANSFRDLSSLGKIRRILAEPGKASYRILHKTLSVIGQSSYTPFLILTRDRTGSNMLVQYLNSHPAIRCEYEVLSHLDGRSGPRMVKKSYGKQPYFIQAKGFKVFYYHPMDADEASVAATWFALESIPGLHLIHLRRRNILETAVSSKLAYETGIYGDLSTKTTSALPSAPARPSISIVYPAEKLQAVFEQTQLWEQEWPKRFRRCAQLEITYEDLASQPETELGSICHFLGITQPFELCTSFRKQRTKSLRSILINYDDLKQYFAGSSWEKFFIE